MGTQVEFTGFLRFGCIIGAVGYIYFCHSRPFKLPSSSMNER